MSDQWYYARQGQQKGPVLLAQLLDMAQSGQLRRNDLVWRSGTPDWVPAGDVPEIFPAGAAPSGPVGAAPRPRAREWGDEEYAPPKREKSGVGLILFLIFGGVGLVALLCCGGGGLVIWFSMPSYDLNKSGNLAFGQSRTYSITLQRNTSYTIELTSRDFDAYLELKDTRNRTVRRDDDGGRGLNSKIVYRPSSTGTYRVVVQALGRGGGGRYTVTVRH